MPEPKDWETVKINLSTAQLDLLQHALQQFKPYGARVTRALELGMAPGAAYTEELGMRAEIVGVVEASDELLQVTIAVQDSQSAFFLGMVWMNMVNDDRKGAADA